MTTITSGQTSNVSAGQTSSGITVLSGGTLDVLAGGVISSTIDDGVVNVSGTAISTTVDSGYTITWSGSDNFFPTFIWIQSSVIMNISS